MNNPYRPHYHFTPPANWMNDPNGLVYYEGEYHLFYQYHPHSTAWGPMHWGHAVSRDLVRWEHLPMALYPDEHGMIFSGSVVIDWHNTAGFGPEAMVATFTHHQTKDGVTQQSQSLAYSLDRGRSWGKYEGNPVIPGPEGVPDFRDPKVFWHEPTGRWVMVLAVGEQIWFYTSPDLKAWRKTSEFGDGWGAHGREWEMPDLFELPVGQGGPLDQRVESRWVLITSVGGGAPAGGSGMQYFIGDFEGQTFTPYDTPARIRWVDFGPDFYAAISWSDVPAGRRLWLGWMSNWLYARETPTTTWRGAMSLPRELALVRKGEGLELVQRPVAELQALRGQQWSWQEQSIVACNQELVDISGELLEIKATFQLTDSETRRFGLNIQTGQAHTLTIAYDPQQQSLSVDRTHAGQVDFHPDFAKVHHAPLILDQGLITLHLFLDRSSVEVFANEGQVVFSECIFPLTNQFGLSLFAEGEGVRVVGLDVFELRSAGLPSPLP